MEKVIFAEIEVDRCTSCHGLWFDMREPEHLKDLPGSEVIDYGDAEVGEAMSHIQRIQCPVCHTPMIRMVDNRQPHLHYESCHVCYGVFFDAGEFRDYKQTHFSELIEELLTILRKPSIS